VSSRLRLEGGAGFDVAGITLGEYPAYDGDGDGGGDGAVAAGAARGRSSSGGSGSGKRISVSPGGGSSGAPQHLPQAALPQRLPSPPPRLPPPQPRGPPLFAGDAGGSRLHDPFRDNLGTAHDGTAAARPGTAAARLGRRQQRRDERAAAVSAGIGRDGRDPVLLGGAGSALGHSDLSDGRARVVRPLTSPPLLGQRLEARLEARSAHRSGRPPHITVVASGDGVAVPLSPLGGGCHRSRAVASDRNHPRLEAASHRVPRPAPESGGGGGFGGVAARARRSQSSGGSDMHDRDDAISVGGKSCGARARRTADSVGALSFGSIPA
jgi:hypothetical protein